MMVARSSEPPPPPELLVAVLAGGAVTVIDTVAAFETSVPSLAWNVKLSLPV
jgi:hypothetical protein